MKKRLTLFVTLFFATTVFAQTQQGYVKTKGRMVNGQLVPGQGLKGATVSIKGRTAVLVNSDDGSFSFPVTQAQFQLDSVKKKGYQLVDSEALSRSYKPSDKPRLGRAIPISPSVISTSAWPISLSAITRRR